MRNEAISAKSIKLKDNDQLFIALSLKTLMELAASCILIHFLDVFIDQDDY